MESRVSKKITWRITKGCYYCQRVLIGLASRCYHKNQISQKSVIIVNYMPKTDAANYKTEVFFYSIWTCSQCSCWHAQFFLLLFFR